MASCASTKNETILSPYSGIAPPPGRSALVYGLPQTRLFFDVEISKTVIKKGPYAEYAARMLGLQNVPMKDSESWQIKSIRIGNRQEVDGKHLYTLFFTDYPQNMDKLLRFTKEGVILDLTVSNQIIGSSHGTFNDDFHLANTVIRNASIEKVDTIYKSNADTSFVRIPVLQRRILSKTTEELAREAADQIFDIRKWRTDILRGDVEHPTDGEAFGMILKTLDKQEEQMLSMFIGVKNENSQTITYSEKKKKTESKVDLFYFSEKNGIINKNTAGAKAVWYETGKVTAHASVNINLQARDIIYYRIPQVVEVTAGIDRNMLVSELVSVCQFGNIVSFPLVSPKK
jgi:hypothetical protein